MGTGLHLRQCRRSVRLKKLSDHLSRFCTCSEWQDEQLLRREKPTLLFCPYGAVQFAIENENLLYIAPTKFTFKVARFGLGGPSLPSCFAGNRLPFSVIPALAKTISILPCSAYTFSKTAVWLSQEDTSHSSNETLANGCSARSSCKV